MSTDAVLDEIAHPEAHEGDGHAHPTDALFVKTAIILAVITAIEVAWSYLPWADEGMAVAAEIGGLLFMMAIKFYIVANTFMHLKWEKKILTGFFYGGLILAIIVYLIALTTFEFFGGTAPYAG